VQALEGKIVSGANGRQDRLAIGYRPSQPIAFSEG
jgi:hypothetical protein